MRRISMFVLAAALALAFVSSAAVAEVNVHEFSNPHISVTIDDTIWSVTRISTPNAGLNADKYELIVQSRTQADKVIWLLLDDLVDANGESINLQNAGNLTFSDIPSARNPVRIDDRSREGFYSFECTDNTDSKYTLVWVFEDATVDRRIESGQYFRYVVRSSVTNTERDTILAGLGINGTGGNGGGGSTGGTPPTTTDDTVGSSGGGGCSAGFGSLALLALCSAFIVRKSR